MQIKPVKDVNPDDVSLKDALLELVWPTRCVGCESLGELLCPSCKAALKLIDSHKACSHCGAPFGQIICTECYGALGPEQFSFTQAVCALEFEAISARMVVLYKNQDEHRLAELMAELIYLVMPKRWQKWANCICWIPADTKTLRRRGFDHMQKVALELAQLTKRPALAILGKKPVRDQRQLNREQRRLNLQDCFVANSQPPANILLIDDVLTTGATLEIASQTLLDAGAKEVRVATLARVW